MEIGKEKLQEQKETETVVREAFWNVYSPGCSEHYLLHRMRTCPAFVPDLNLAAREDGRIIGHVISLKSFIEGDDGNRYEVLSLGPIAVLPQYQRRGVGAEMIAETKRIAGKLGYRAILLCGDPAFYTGQGFEAAEKYGIRNGEDMYVDALHVFGLYEGALEHLAGRYYEDAVYNVDEAAVMEYDRAFPLKTPLSGTPSQLRFQEMASRCRPFRQKR